MSLKPLRASILIAALFLAVSMVYLWLSTQWGAEATSTVADVAEYEFVKGTIFMIVAAAGIFGLCYFFMSRIAEQQAQIARTREHLLDVQGRVLTGTLTASVAHDLKNLLAVIQPNLEFAADESLSDEERMESLDDALLAAQGLSSLSERLARVSSRGQEDEPEKCDLAELTRSAVEMVRAHSKLNGRTIKVIARDAIHIRVYPDLAVHAIINLLINAADATEPDGKILIYVRRRTESVELEVHDDGHGIPEEIRFEMLEPFRTTKTEGTGLGLFIVGHFARMHGGRIELEESEMGGALVRVSLPRDSEVSLSESDPIFLPERTVAASTEQPPPDQISDTSDTIEESSPPISE